ncbi:MAG: hypothetical protein HQ552_03195 [Desulfobacteraceae bacterium]|nr:hypothetical protein [Desulfobacteraceae bacterium]
MVKKIISGGQIGADQAALDVAIKLGIPHGGWIQKGRKTQSGTLPDKYKLKEMPTASYIKRIEQNVIDSDGTLIISYGILTGGSDHSRKMVLKHKRQLLHIDLSQIAALQAAKLINSWISLYHIKILNITGPRTSEDPKIYKAVMDILESAYYLSQVEDRILTLDSFYQTPPKDRSSSPPIHTKTVDDAVELLITEMPLKDRATMANFTKDELAPLNMTLGIYIRNHLFQKGANSELLASCSHVSENEHLSESDAAFVIIEKLWEKLRVTHRLRIVK